MTLEDLEKKRLKQRCFYTKEEIKEILDNISLKVVVDNLPAEGIENYLYLVPSNTEEDLYNQYFWDGTEWQNLGESKVIFTDYVTEPELDLAVLEYLPIIEDTRNANIAAITGKAPFATLKAGLKILLHLTYYTPDNSTLNLTLSDGTTTGAKSIVYQADDGTALLVPISNTYGRYKSRLYVLMIYESASSRWICATPVNKNTTYSTTTKSEIETGTDTTGKLVSPNTLNTLFSTKQNVRTVQQETVSSNTVTIALDATKYHTCSAAVDSITVTLPANYTAADVFLFSFTCNSSSCVLTLPSGVYLGNSLDFLVDRLAGRKFQVTISDDIALYCFAE